MFQIIRTGPSDRGDPVFFFCQLPSGSQIQNEKCFFKTRNGTTLYTNPKEGSGVYNEDDREHKPISGLKAMSPGTNKNICGLTIEKISDEYFGNWTCIINQGLSNIPEHRGNFILLTNEDPYPEESLPRHVIPEHYDLHLTPFLDGGNFTAGGVVKMSFRVVPDDKTNEVLKLKTKLIYQYIK